MKTYLVTGAAGFIGSNLLMRGISALLKMILIMSAVSLLKVIFVIVNLLIDCLQRTILTM